MVQTEKNNTIFSCEWHLKLVVSPFNQFWYSAPAEISNEYSLHDCHDIQQDFTLNKFMEFILIEIELPIFVRFLQDIQLKKSVYVHFNDLFTNQTPGLTDCQSLSLTD